MKIISLTTTFAMAIFLAFANLNVNAQAFELPFFEDWQSWHFETNQWQTDGDNWQMDTQNGNDAPSAKFHRTPILTDYSSALTSNTFDASLLSVGRIFLNFDLKLTDNNETGTEFMHFQVFDGTDWININSVSNQGSFNWTAYSLEITNWAMGNEFKIRFLATGENSLDMLDWHIDNIEVYRKSDRPEELRGEHVWGQEEEPPGALIEWNAPESVFPKSEWKHWDSGENYSGVGLICDCSFYVAIRWDAGMLYNYHNDTIESVRFFIHDEYFEYVVLNIWTGENAANLIYSDTAQNVVPGEWNEHQLNETIIINQSFEYWVGYEIFSLTPGTPAGTDSSPAVAGYGDMVSLDNLSSWDKISDYGPDFNFNWNIQMFVDGEPIQNPDDLLGFNVYRMYLDESEYSQIDFVNFENEQNNYFLFDTCIQFQWNPTCDAFYKVNAKWGSDDDTCTSDFAMSYELPMDDFISVVFSGTEEFLSENKVLVFPNPTTISINIKSETQLQTVSIFNLFGQKVETFDTRP